MARTDLLQLRRDTQAAFDALVGGQRLELGEPFVTTDTGRLYCGTSNPSTPALLAGGAVAYADNADVVAMLESGKAIPPSALLDGDGNLNWFLDRKIPAGGDFHGRFLRVEGGGLTVQDPITLEQSTFYPGRITAGDISGAVADITPSAINLTTTGDVDFNLPDGLSYNFNMQGGSKIALGPAGLYMYDGSSNTKAFIDDSGNLVCETVTAKGLGFNNGGGIVNLTTDGGPLVLPTSTYAFGGLGVTSLYEPDSGIISVNSTIVFNGQAGFWGATGPGSQPAAPTDTSSIISLLQAYGLCS